MSAHGERTRGQAGGHEVALLSLRLTSTLDEDRWRGARVVRVPIQMHCIRDWEEDSVKRHFHSLRSPWVEAMDRFVREHDIEVLHVHDWLTAFAGISFKHHMKKPMVLTVHSTEIGRAQGLHSADSFSIDGIEWWAGYESSRVVVTSHSMKREICDHFHLPWDKVDVIPNAIDAT